MKTFSKRLLTFVLACAMVFGLSGMTTFAAEADEPDAEIDSDADAGIATLSAEDEIVTLADEAAAYTPDYSWYEDAIAKDPAAEEFTITDADDLACRIS